VYVKLKKTVLMTMMSTVLALSAIGCSGGDSKTSDGAKASPAKDSGAGNTAGNSGNGNGMPISKEPITITMAYKKVSSDKTDASAKAYIKKLAQESNITIKWIPIPEQAAAEKVNLMLAGGDLPDVFLAELISPSAMSTYYSSGMFVPLNKYLEKSAPNYSKIFNENADVKSYLTMEDGNIYALPAGQMAPWLYYDTIYYMNKKWLDNLGLAVPQTTEEYYRVLKAFKEKDANGNGNMNDEIPLSLTTDSTMSQFISFGQAFGIPMNNDYVVVKDGKVSFGPASDRFREMTDYLHKLYAEGLLDKESLAQKGEQINAKGKNEAAPLLGATSQFLYTSTVGKWADQYTFVPPLKGPHGDQAVRESLILPAMVVIMKNNKHIEETLKLFDYMNQDMKHQLEAGYGLESDGLWTITPEGQFIINSNKVPSGLTYDEWWKSSSMGASFPVYQNPKFVADKRKVEGVDINASLKLAADNAYKKFKAEGQMPAIILPKDLQDNINGIRTDLVTLVTSFLSQSIIEGATDNSWSKFQKDLEKAKVQEYTKLQQQVYDKRKK
jgi:putative aldouronate transport system substrate-binding protein